MDEFLYQENTQSIKTNDIFWPKHKEFKTKRKSHFPKFIVLFSTISISYYLWGFSPVTLKEQVKDSITIEQKNYTKTGFDNYYQMSLIIKNNSNYEIENIKLKCNHYAYNDIQIGKNFRKISTTIKSESQKNFNNLAMGLHHSKTKNVKCEIIDFMIN